MGLSNRSAPEPRPPHTTAAIHAAKGRFARTWAAFVQYAPPWRHVLPGALLWACLMGFSASLNLISEGWQASERIRDVALVFAAGGAVAFPLGIMGATLISRGRRAEARFAAAFLALVLATIGATAAIYALEYRIYYAQWHAAAFSLTWIFQLVFTALVSTVQFAVSGLPLYFPVGFLAVPVAALWFARQPR